MGDGVEALAGDDAVGLGGAHACEEEGRLYRVGCRGWWGKFVVSHPSRRPATLRLEIVRYRGQKSTIISNITPCWELQWLRFEKRF